MGTADALRRSRELPVAFADVYRVLSEPVLVFLTRRTFDLDIALELTAETFARAYQQRARFRGTTDAEAEGWIFAMARNLLTRWYRRGAVERRALARMSLDVPELAPEDYERVERLADLAGRRAELAQALRDIAPDQREAIQLRVVDELPYPEIAARTGVTEQVVRARVSRGLNRMAAALERGPA